jgi:protein-disulfide isomerase
MKHRIMPLLLPLVVTIAFAGPASGQGAPDSSRTLADTRRALARVEDDLAIVKSQLGEVLRLLNRAPTAARSIATGPVRANIAGAPTLGRADAPVTLVEFTDYQCPFCQRFFATTLRTLIAEYVDSGKVRYVVRDHPLDQLHPNARKAAEAAHCAGDQGKYWEMHDVLFASGGALAADQLINHARAVGLDSVQFDECLASGRHAAEVQRGVADGAAAGVQGTPSFVIGPTGDGDVVEGTPVRGAQPIETFRRIIDQALRGGTAAVQVRREAAASRSAQPSTNRAVRPQLLPTRRCLNAHVCAPRQ